MHDNFNVVVFSSQGERPAFNKMSNGDLDGDTYFVCWDQELTQHFDPSEPNEVKDIDFDFILESFPQQKPAKQEISDHLVWFYKNDNMGQINNLHLAICDYFGKYGPQ